MTTDNTLPWTDATAFDDVPDDDVTSVQLDGRDIALYKVEGSVFATDNTCTHGHARLKEQHRQVFSVSFADTGLGDAKADAGNREQGV